MTDIGDDSVPVPAGMMQTAVIITKLPCTDFQLYEFITKLMNFTPDRIITIVQMDAEQHQFNV